MSKHTIKLYYDYSSPYSYFASLRIEALCERTGAGLLWLPVVLGGIFQSNETEPPHTKSNRRKYLADDLKDLADFYGVPYQPRTTFLFHPILSMRATLGVPQGPERARAAHALFHGAWALDLDLGDAEVVQRLLDEAGLDGKALVEGSQEQAIKDELKALTDEAIARGMFGVPTFVVDDRKMFWGHDRMPLLEHYLAAAS